MPKEPESPKPQAIARVIPAGNPADAIMPNFQALLPSRLRSNQPPPPRIFEQERSYHRNVTGMMEEDLTFLEKHGQKRKAESPVWTPEDTPVDEAYGRLNEYFHDFCDQSLREAYCLRLLFKAVGRTPTKDQLAGKNEWQWWTDVPTSLRTRFWILLADQIQNAVVLSEANDTLYSYSQTQIAKKNSQIAELDAESRQQKRRFESLVAEVTEDAKSFRPASELQRELERQFPTPKVLKGFLKRNPEVRTREIKWGKKGGRLFIHAGELHAALAQQAKKIWQAGDNPINDIVEAAKAHERAKKSTAPPTAHGYEKLVKKIEKR